MIRNMQGIRIIKRDHAVAAHSSPPVQEEKPVRQIEREIAGTVKNWIVELAQRRPVDEQKARTQFFAAIH